MTDFDAINVILNNRSLLKRRKFKEVKKLLIKTSGKTQLEFNTVTSEELEAIKTEIRKHAKRNTWFEILIYGSFSLILFSILVYISILILNS